MKMRTASLLTLIALLLLSSCTIQLAKDIFDYDENPFLNPETIAEPHEEGTIRFLAFSDLHINRSATQSDVTERYEEIINVIECGKKEEKFDFIMNLGDLNDSGDINEPRFIDFIDALSASGIPSVNLLGNHELHKTKDKSIWENFFRGKEGLYGPVGCYRIGDSLSIYALDNSQRLFTVKQLQYLEEAIASDESRYKILIMHENITSGQADDHSSVLIGTADTAERNRVYRLMAEYGASLMLYCYYYCKKHGEDKEKLLANYKEIRAKDFLPLLKESFWALLTPVIILGTIYSGICSPTESAVISVFYGLFVCIFIYKTIKVRDLGHVFMEGAKTYVNILFVIAAATAFARCLTMLRYPQTISESVLALSDNRVVILLIMNVIMLVCGMIIDNIPNIMILTPIMAPIATAVGVDPVHFGIIMTCNLAIGMVTPPMGINLFVAAGMTKIPMLKLARACVPFLIAFIISLMIITFVPGLSMALPGLIG